MSLMVVVKCFNVPPAIYINTISTGNYTAHIHYTHTHTPYTIWHIDR